MGQLLESLGAWHRIGVHSRRAGALAEHFAGLIPPRHSVLDVGCGDGLIASLLSQRRPDLTVEGVDVLLRPAAYIPVTAFDGTRLPFRDHSWGTVVLCDVLHHSEQPVLLLKEAARVAQHSIVIKDHVLQGVLARPTLRFMDFVGNAPHGVALPYNYLSANEWTRAFQECGLRLAAERRRLGMYPSIANWIFGRSLHFIALLEVVGDRRC